MNATEVLGAGGILRPADVVELARGARLDLASAATVLQMESGGGRNVWGHDGVNPHGAYDKGGVVTRDNYTAYLRIRRGNAQGVGPCQLTWPPLQDRADAAGGCWRWEANCAVGFRHLAELIERLGVRDGFRAYNGTGPAAEKYADKAMAIRARWVARLPSALLKPGDRGDAVKDLQRKLGVTPVSGWFGPVTEAAVRAHQAAHGLTVDGVVGSATWAAL